MAWADLSDCRCYFEVVGRGQPLILIPGLAATSRIWDPIVHELGQFFSIILYDNRGIGQSIPKRTAHSLSEISSDIVELLDFLQIDRVHVLGVSLGGVIAQRVAIDHPSRVNRLVLVSCADTFSPYLRQITTLLAHTLRRFPREMFVRTMELLATAPEFHDANAALVEQRVQNKCRSRVSARAVANQLRCLSCSEADLTQHRIVAPTLVVAGEYDPIIPGCYARRMSEKIPGSVYHVVPSGGHNPLIDHPALTLPKVIEFLHETEPAEQQNGMTASYMPYLGGLATPMEAIAGR